MIKTLRMALKVDLTYSINSYIYALRKMFGRIIKDDVYARAGMKKLIRIIGAFISFLRMIIFKFFYFSILYYICNLFMKNSLKESFIHVYFIFTIIGMFCNNHLLSIGIKKYLAIILFKMDAKDYMKANLWWNLFLNFVMNILCLASIGGLIGYGFNTVLMLAIFTSLVRIVGETINVWFYHNYGYDWTINYKLFYTLLISFLLMAFLPIFNIYVTNKFIFISILLFIPIATVCYIYLSKFKHYGLLFKRINTLKKAVNSDQSKTYSRQELVSIKDKDKIINSKKIAGKHGYDLFNTIFFERHREILFRSAKNYSLIIAFIIVGLIVSLFVPGLNTSLYIHSAIIYRFNWLLLIMYFINRGAIITQAMFYNCDHAMLTYNFYRQPDVLLGLFKKRLKLLIKINSYPAIVLALGSIILLALTGGTSIINYITIPLFIIVLSVFFSVHYLVIYYLLQPFTKELELKNFSYTLASFGIYFITFELACNLKVSAAVLSSVGLVLTGLYIFIALIIVKKYAPSTFKINK